MCPPAIVRFALDLPLGAEEAARALRLASSTPDLQLDLSGDNADRVFVRLAETADGFEFVRLRRLPQRAPCVVVQLLKGPRGDSPPQHDQAKVRIVPDLPFALLLALALPLAIGLVHAGFSGTFEPQQTLSVAGLVAGLIGFLAQDYRAECAKARAFLDAILHQDAAGTYARLIEDATAAERIASASGEILSARPRGGDRFEILSLPRRSPGLARGDLVRAIKDRPGGDLRIAEMVLAGGRATGRLRLAEEIGLEAELEILAALSAFDIAWERLSAQDFALDLPDRPSTEAFDSLVSRLREDKGVVEFRTGSD